jgi:hypothetical protein
MPITDMILTLTTEWFWGASHRALKKSAKGVVSSRIAQAYASSAAGATLERERSRKDDRRFRVSYIWNRGQAGRRRAIRVRPKVLVLHSVGRSSLLTAPVVASVNLLEKLCLSWLL